MKQKFWLIKEFYFSQNVDLSISRTPAQVLFIFGAFYTVYVLVN